MALRNMRVWSTFFLIILLCGCVPSSGNKASGDDIVIKQGVIGGKRYYVPEPYFKLKGRYFRNDNIYLRVMYPDFSPLDKEPMELFKDKQWYRNISILANKRNSDIEFDEFAQGTIKNLKAFEVVGDEYGLIHQGQPDGYVKDHYDIWLEKVTGKYVSYITCSEKRNKVSVPQCNQHFYIGKRFWVKISYDRRLLPHWKLIKQEVLEMFRSFEYEHSAREYIQKKLNEIHKPKHGVSK